MGEGVASAKTLGITALRVLRHYFKITGLALPTYFELIFNYLSCPRASLHRLSGSRWVVALICLLAAVLALLVPDSIFRRVLFAWHAVGSAFGPLLFFVLIGRRPPAGQALASMLTGFCLTVALHWLPDTPGDWAERLIPLAAAAAVAGFRLTPGRRS